ncbi:MAG: 50S ribosomal protein L24 [Bdellovibrio sp.]|nr:MAG: 50S ribosomal protein L24 [Bdellovibrio sp.]
MKLKIKKGDTVQVIAGSDKGRQGSVLYIDPVRLKIRVQGVRVQKKHDKKEGKIIEREGLIDYSNVKLVKKATAQKSKKKATLKKASAQK